MTIDSQYYLVTRATWAHNCLNFDEDGIGDDDTQRGQVLSRGQKGVKGLVVMNIWAPTCSEMWTILMTMMVIFKLIVGLGNGSNDQNLTTPIWWGGGWPDAWGSFPPNRFGLQSYRRAHHIIDLGLCPSLQGLISSIDCGLQLLMSGLQHRTGQRDPQPREDPSRDCLMAPMQWFQGILLSTDANTQPERAAQNG